MSNASHLPELSDPLAHPDQFVSRHVGPSQEGINAMLKAVGFDSLEALTDRVVPEAIRMRRPLKLDEVMSEQEALTPPFTANVIDKLSGDLYDLVYGQPFRLPVELIFVMRALSTFEGVGRSLDPAFSLVAIAKPYLLPLCLLYTSPSPRDRG